MGKKKESNVTVTVYGIAYPEFAKLKWQQFLRGFSLAVALLVLIVLALALGGKLPREMPLTMIVLSFCAIRGVVYANGQTGAARNMRHFHIGVLCFAFAEYLLWTAGCFWPDTSPASPTFWCDMLLTLAILWLLPATRKAVEA